MKKNVLPQGFLAAGLNCGIKKKGYDLGLIACQDFYRAAGFFTSNCNVSYSVSFCRKNIKNPVKAILVNSGNANCFSDKKGYQDTEEIAGYLAKALAVDKKNILFASTGIIGKKLPKNKIIKKISQLTASLENNAEGFARGILTTDTKLKIVSETLFFGKKKVRVSGIVKGAGMIKPNLATMLGFILTDADIDLVPLRKKVKESLETSFNAINIDGAESTNDSLFAISSRKVPLTEKEKKRFLGSLAKIMIKLSKMIVEDAEGSTKFVQLDIKGAKTKKEARRIANEIAGYILFKCALYGNRPNTGRIIAALGQQGIRLTEDDLGIKFSSLEKREVSVVVDLKRGSFSQRVYTCDLSPEYVKINADYN